jgi:hypothetical protein
MKLSMTRQLKGDCLIIHDLSPGIVTRVTRRGVHLLDLYISVLYFVDRFLSFCPFSFCHWLSFFSIIVSNFKVFLTKWLTSLKQTQLYKHKKTGDKINPCSFVFSREKESAVHMWRVQQLAVLIVVSTEI